MYCKSPYCSCRFAPHSCKTSPSAWIPGWQHSPWRPAPRVSWPSQRRARYAAQLRQLKPFSSCISYMYGYKWVIHSINGVITCYITCYRWRITGEGETNSRGFFNDLGRFFDRVRRELRCRKALGKFTVDFSEMKRVEFTSQPWCVTNSIPANFIPTYIYLEVSVHEEYP